MFFLMINIINSKYHSDIQFTFWSVRRVQNEEQLNTREESNYSETTTYVKASIQMRILYNVNEPLY